MNIELNGKTKPLSEEERMRVHNATAEENAAYFRRMSSEERIAYKRAWWASLETKYSVEVLTDTRSFHGAEKTTGIILIDGERRAWELDRWKINRKPCPEMYDLIVNGEVIPATASAEEIQKWEEEDNALTAEMQAKRDAFGGEYDSFFEGDMQVINPGGLSGKRILVSYARKFTTFDAKDTIVPAPPRREHQ
jgi:hypothetical protein